MAVVEFSIKDFEKLVGRKLTKSELEEKLVMMGFPLEGIEKDKIFYEVFPNRPDMLSVEGFARSARFFLGIDKNLPNYKFKNSGVSITIDKSVKDVRPYFVGAVAKNVKLTDELVKSLMQVQEKLHDTLGRKRKKVAIGVHDFDKVKQPFVYKAVSPDQISFVPLDMQKSISMREICRIHPKGVKYAHILEGQSKWPIILDSRGEVLSFPPIINGELTRVSEKTKNLFIDITGTSEIAVNQALNVITAMLHERGCQVEKVSLKGLSNCPTPNENPKKMKIDSKYVSKLLGIAITETQMKSLLMKMGIGFSSEAVIPYYRADIMHPMDLAEEIAIAYGYQNFEPVLPNIATHAMRSQKNEFSTMLRKIMIGMGFQETIGMILTNEEDEFEKMLFPKEHVCETANPLTIECAMCRKNILPSIMRTIAYNKNREYPQKIFEIGDVLILDSKAETGAFMKLKMAAAISDVSVGYESLSPELDGLMRNLGISYQLKKFDSPSFIAGRCAQIVVNGEPIGFIGEINPQVLENWNIDKPVVAFETDLDKIMK